MKEIFLESARLIPEIGTVETQKSFLGCEYLLWLWFVAETEGGEFAFSPSLPSSHSSSKKLTQGRFWIEDKIVLASSIGESHHVTIKGGVPSKSSEAASSLLSGKSIVELRIGLALGDLEGLALTLRSDELSPRSIQIPELFEGSEQSALDHRIQATFLLDAALSSLLQKFLNERCSKVWEDSRLGPIKNWIQSRASHRESISYN